MPNWCNNNITIKGPKKKIDATVAEHPELQKIDAIIDQLAAQKKATES